MPKQIDLAASTERKAWVKPDVRQLEAADAEIAGAPVADAGVFS